MIFLDYLALFVVRFLVFIIQRIPERYGIYLCRMVVAFLFLLMPRSKAVGRRNLEMVFPEKSKEERESILDRSIEVLARNLLTYCKLPLLNSEIAKEKIDYSGGRELCDKLRRENPGKGIILATLHYGSFELIIQIQTMWVGKAWILARGFGLPNLDEFWFSRREIFGSKVFRRKGAFPEIIRRLQAGEDVAILFDQNVKINHAVFVDFLGRKAATTKTLGLAAVRTGAPIAFGIMHEHEEGKYTLLFEEIPTAALPGENSDETVERITQSLCNAAEKVIRKHPENWFWIHRRFKTRPPGEPEDLYERLAIFGS